MKQRSVVCYSWTAGTVLVSLCVSFNEAPGEGATLRD